MSNCAECDCIRYVRPMKLELPAQPRTVEINGQDQPVSVWIEVVLDEPCDVNGVITTPDWMRMHKRCPDKGGSVHFFYDANPAPLPRHGFIRIGDFRVAVKQNGTPASLPTSDPDAAFGPKKVDTTYLQAYAMAVQAVGQDHTKAHALALVLMEALKAAQE